MANDINLISGLRQVSLGAIGWRHPEWGKSFYPSDMPDDWQLTYFNTQFDCVYVPQSEWQQASSKNLSSWYADTHEQFRFLLEGPAMESIPTELQGKSVMVCREDAALIWFSRVDSLKDIAASIQKKTDVETCFLISIDGDLAQIERVTTLLELLGL